MVILDISDHFLDKNSNQEVSLVSSQDSLNNLTTVAPSNSGFGLDQNLNLTLSQALRPPSLPVVSPLNRPDPSEVDDEAPLTFDPSPASHLIPSHDVSVDPDLLNGNVSSDGKLTCSQEGCEANGSVIT